MLKLRTRLSKTKHIILFLVLSIGFTVNTFADGLPGEYYVTQRWRDLLAGHSPATNPAFMTEENYFTCRLALSPTLQYSFLLSEIGAILPIGLYQSIGVTYLGLAAQGDIEQTQFEGGEFIQTGDKFDDVHSLFIASYAINPWNRLSIGANLNLYHKRNFGDPIIGVGFDLAFSYRFLRHAVLGDHVLGLNFQNLVSPSFTGTEDAGLWNEAVNLKVSWLAKIWESRIDFGIDLDIKDFLSQTEDFVGEVVDSAGDITEFGSKTIEADINARVGFWILRMINIYFQAGSSYWGITPGINVPTVNKGRDFQVAYQYMSIIDDEPLTSTHTIYFRGDFGPHREEVYARRMARLASLGPADLYNRARTLFSQEKYWDAFFIFGKILVEYPDFFKNDWVQLHMGLCQEYIDMREFSAENYNIAKKSYPKSVVIPYADLGLMRLHYREGNSSGVANQFHKLNTSSTPDSLKFHAYYYMGLQHIKDGEYQKAIQILSLVPENHPEYAFAQHSLSSAYALTDNINKSIEALDNVIQVVPKTKEQTEVINRSFVFLGYIFFEGLGGQERSLSKAVSALRRVPNTSYYYEDALIGLAWTALRASQWADCISACDQLLTVSKKSALRCEAMLLKAYCAGVDKKYAEAVAILRPASEEINKALGPSESKKNAKALEYDNNRGVYYEIASNMNNLALTSQSSFTIQQIDSLHVPQMDYEKKLNDHYVFVDEFGRSSFFARNIEKVRDDIEYALAKFEKMIGTRKVEKVIGKDIEEIERLKKEEEELMKELEKLEEGEEEE